MRYDESWDRPHVAGADPRWQESDCYWFFDRERRIGGFHRIGRHPNREHGASMLFVFSPEARFRRIDAFDWADCRVDDGSQQLGGHRAEALGKGRMRYAWSEPETEAQLEWTESFYEPRGWLAGERGEALASRVKTNTDGHLECSGRLRGALRLGEHALEIDALAHRDRSWGVRDMSLPWQHRMFSGTVGPELSFATFIMQLRDGSTHRAGFVARDGESRDIEDLRILSTFDYDGFTVESGRAELTLTGGERLTIDAKAIEGFTSQAIDDYVSTDHICTFDHDGRQGFLDLEIANNPTRGNYLPKAGEVARVCTTTGLEPVRGGH